MPENIPIEDLDIYQLAIEIGEDVWRLVDKWEIFQKNTVGKQYVQAADSIAANIAEVYGRYFYKDRKQFCYYARGSMLETKTWTVKSNNRKLITANQYETLIEKLKTLHHKLNIYIKKLKQNITAGKEQA